MKILLTPPRNEIFERHFPQELTERLGKLGELTVNPHDRNYTRSELMREIADTDIVVTIWGSAQYDRELLEHAPKLRLIGHCAGTVAHIASAECYERGIKVLSANSVMARYVAEGALAMILSALRELCPCDKNMREGKWIRPVDTARSLIGGSVGFIGLGTVGRCLLDLLRPFDCGAAVYDPYIADGALDKWEFARKASFAEAMSRPVVTIHASQTPETFHMINAEALSLIPDGGLLVNTSRGSLVDTSALIRELSGGRIRAALDVYEREGAPQQPELLACGNALLSPHMAGEPAGALMTAGIIDDIERFIGGRELKLAVSRNQFDHMTQE